MPHIPPGVRTCQPRSLPWLPFLHGLLIIRQLYSDKIVMRKAALYCLLPVLFNMAHARAAANVDATQVYFLDNELVYAGKLDPDANQRLFALYDSLKDKPTVLSIRSVGGSTTDGLALGQWVRDHKLDVKVVEYCMSSCANYVFPAGVRKEVSNFAVIGFHGGLSSASFTVEEATQKMLDSLPPDQRKAMLAQFQATIDTDAKKEQAYLAALGVRGDYVTLGQEERYQRLYPDDPKVVGWTYSLEDFGRLGVHGISVINPPWRPGSALKKMSFAVIKLVD